MYTKELSKHSAESMWDEVLASPEEANRIIMRRLVDFATPGYTCLRPPGAAGALLIIWGKIHPGSGLLLGCAEPPAGPTCKEIGACEIEDGHCVRTIHAEVNAILMAARLGYVTYNSAIYSILKPCYQCSKVIVAAGIREIVYAGAAYDEERTRKLLEWAGVKTTKVDIGLSYG